RGALRQVDGVDLGDLVADLTAAGGTRGAGDDDRVEAERRLREDEVLVEDAAGRDVDLTADRRHADPLGLQLVRTGRHVEHDVLTTRTGRHTDVSPYEVDL